MELIRGIASIDQSKLNTEGYKRRRKLKHGRYVNVKKRVVMEAAFDVGLSAVANVGRVPDVTYIRKQIRSKSEIVRHIRLLFFF